MIENAADKEAKARAERFAKLLKDVRQDFLQRSFADRINPDGVQPLSKRKLSQFLGVSATLVNKYENAEIDPWDIRWSVLNKVAKIANISLQDLDGVIEGKEVAEVRATTKESGVPYSLICELEKLVQKYQ
ncbi:helix-turn-helix domain-containing protein [Synechococcus elongatus]|uniref:helix-turn-helix domain-containing protein n=1 Tax=Synechococcus elongatus TaxID=32046 RepID=UPI000F7E9B6D|nr:helix-turn-helix transcriptional regulator [Synechococcus elongatus]